MGGVAWTEEEDQLLRKCIEQYGEGKWHRIPVLAGINRCRKSCRLRWLNYLRPNIRRGRFTDEEVELIIQLHHHLGNRWSVIAGRLPGRTANDVKNYWHCHLSKRLKSQLQAKPVATSHNSATDDQVMIKQSWQQQSLEANSIIHELGDAQEKSVSISQQHDHVASVSQTAAAEQEDEKLPCIEEHKFMDDLLAVDFDFELEDIKITGCDHRNCNWDFDDFMFDMEIR